MSDVGSTRDIWEKYPPPARGKIIPITELEHGRVYELKSRNLFVGVWNAHRKGFIGIREKFDRRFLFTEYEYSTSSQVGTAWALKDLGITVDAIIPISERIRLREDQPIVQNEALFKLLNRLDKRHHRAWVRKEFTRRERLVRRWRRMIRRFRR